MDKTILAVFICLVVIGIIATGVIVTTFLHYDVTPGRFFITNVLIGAAITIIIIFTILTIVFLKKL